MSIWLALLIVVGSLWVTWFLAGPVVDFIVRHWDFFQVFRGQERRVR